MNHQILKNKSTFQSIIWKRSWKAIHWKAVTEWTHNETFEMRDQPSNLYWTNKLEFDKHCTFEATWHFCFSTQPKHTQEESVLKLDTSHL